MSINLNFAAAIGIVAGVAACTPAQPPVPIQAEPIFNKVGAPTGKCTNGYDFNSQTRQCEPPRECHEAQIVGGPVVPCPPPGECVDGYILGSPNVPCTPPPHQGGQDERRTQNNNGGGNALVNNY